jgi:hypothetical protein
MWEKKRELEDLWDMPPEVEGGINGTPHLQVALGMISTRDLVQQKTEKSEHNTSKDTQSCVVS